MRTTIAIIAVSFAACQFDSGGSAGEEDARVPTLPDAADVADGGADPDADPGAPDADPADPDAAPTPDAAPIPDAPPEAIGLITTGSASTVGSLGGTGGVPFTEDCPDGRVVTGLFAKDNSFGLTRLGAMCSRLEITGGGSVTTADPIATGTHGSETSVVDTPSRNCSGNDVVVGFSGTASSSDLVHSITLRCAAVSWDGTDYSIGAASDASTLGSPDPDQTGEGNCAADEVAGGFSGRAGTILDQFRLRCYALEPVFR